MIKRGTCALLCAALMLCLCACGGGKPIEAKVDETTDLEGLAITVHEPYGAVQYGTASLADDFESIFLIVYAEIEKGTSDPVEGANRAANFHLSWTNEDGGAERVQSETGLDGENVSDEFFFNSPAELAGYNFVFKVPGEAYQRGGFTFHYKDLLVVPLKVNQWD